MKTGTFTIISGNYFNVKKMCSMSDSLSSICVQCEDDGSPTNACIIFAELAVVQFQVHF